MSGDSPNWCPKNSGGATPTTVKTVAPSVSFLPTTPRSPGIVHNGNRMCVFDCVIFFTEHPSDQSLHADRGKVASRNQLDVHGLGGQMAFYRPVHQVQHARGRGDVREDLVAFLHFTVKRVGIEFAVRKLVADAVIEPVAENHQLLRVLHWKRAQHQRIDQAENRCVGANSERQGKQADQRNSWAAQHGAHAVSRILHKLLEADPAPFHLTFLPPQRGIAKLAPHRAQRFAGCHSRVHFFLLAKFEVQPHLFLELGAHPSPPPECRESSCHFARPAHRFLPLKPS